MSKRKNAGTICDLKRCTGIGRVAKSSGNDLKKRSGTGGAPNVRHPNPAAVPRNPFTTSKAAAQRVYRSVKRFLGERLKLIVTHVKSSIRTTDGLEYLGYEFRGLSGQIRMSRKKLAAFRQRATEILRRNRGISMRTRLNEFRYYARGWPGHFGLDQGKSTFRDLDKWLRRRVRACYLKQWRKSKTRLKQLIKLGVHKRDARGAAKSGKGPWRRARSYRSSVS